MEKIIHICMLLMLSLFWMHEANAGNPWEHKEAPWEREEKQDSLELAQQDSEFHESGYISSEGQEEAE